MKTAVIGVALGAMALAACGGEQERAQAPAASHVEPVESPGADSKKWRGWRWKGKRDRCFFLHEGQCFDSRKKACAAARCGKKECLLNDSAPAVAYCEGSSPAVPAAGSK